MGEAVKEPKAPAAPAPAPAAKGGEAKSAGEAGEAAKPAKPAENGDKTAGAKNGEPGAKNGEPTAGTGQEPGKPQKTGEEPKGKPNYMPFVLMGAVVLFFYFMIMRPQKKREKARREMIGKLKTGDKVVTASGIIGEIMEISDSDAVLKIDPRKDVRMRVRRAAIAGAAGDAASEQAVKDGSS